MSQPLEKSEWIRRCKAELMRLLSNGEPWTEAQTKNMEEYATILADGDDNYYAEEFTPKDAAREELSYGV